jgi:hypothetical protein
MQSVKGIDVHSKSPHFAAERRFIEQGGARTEPRLLRSHRLL